MPAPSARAVLGRASGTKALISPGRVDDRRGVIHSSAVSGVEAFRLGEGIEDPVRPGVGSGTRHPLPVQLIVGDVSVDEQVMKVAGAQSSVDVQRLGQEAGDDEPGAIVHSPLPLELPHSRIDDRVSGTPVAPGRQLLLVAVRRAELIAVADTDTRNLRRPLLPQRRTNVLLPDRVGVGFPVGGEL